uniref:G_PROTEIN_RECEP_F1_2 domain-containing protein n=1 Tax=Strongyloides venezuelensis TaxID=75913 RepID=A0A0K0FTX5_STRVS
MINTNETNSELLPLVSKVLNVNIFILPIFGIFGNICIIMGTIKNKEFKNKCGILIANLSFWHSIMLVFEICSGIRIFTKNSAMERSRCLHTIFLHLFSSAMAKWLMLATGIDRLIAILRPINHKYWNNTLYSIVISLPGLLFALAMVVIGFMTIDDEMLSFCNPISVLITKVKTIYRFIIVGFSFITIILYSLTFIILYIHTKKNFKNDHSMLTIHKEMATSLALNALFFVISTFLGYLIMCLVQIFSFSRTTIDVFDALMAIPILITSSCMYYLLFWRAHRYRTFFKEQFKCRSKLEVKSINTTRISHKKNGQTRVFI